jgi:PAS domain S-box-containing protein
MPEQRIFLSSLPAEPGDRRLAFAVVVTSLLIFLGLAPFARRQLPEVSAFIPIYESALAINDLITAAIFFIQFQILHSRAVLVLAAGYLFTALIIVPHALTFPGLFSPTGLLDAGPQSTAWLYMFWHGGFPIAVICYALLKDPTDGAVSLRASVRPVLVLTIVAVIGAVVGLTLLATAGKAFLPAIMSGNSYTPAMIAVVSTVWGLSLAALLVLWLRRPHTVLDLWLMVVMCAWLFDVALSAVLNAGRFDLGFYAGRAYGFLAATFVLMVLLFETGVLYAQLARLFEAEQQERRREAEERRRIFETSVDLILVVDRQGKVLQVNPSAMAILGYAPSEMLGRSAGDFVYAKDLDAIREEMRRARHGHLVRHFPTRYIHKTGRVVTLAWSGVWSEPEQRHFFIGRDITEQKRIERMKDEFIATVNHELRTPVTSIAGPLGLLMGGAAGDLPDSARRLVAMAQNNSKRLARLVNDILDIERIESGKMRFDFRQVDLKPLVERAIEANSALADEYGVPVRLDAKAADAAVYSDGDRLMQVLKSLLSNAVKFSRRGEEALVTIEVRGEHVRIAIFDHGPGIPNEFKSLIFEKFVQVEATDARKKGGTGLGLSIVKETMMRLGGSIGCDAAPSGGSIFYIDVPRWNFQASADPSAQEASTAEA